MKQKIKLGIILGAEFLAITLILLLIFFAGKKSYTVTFDLNGGTLISGELEQVIPQGKSATPPTVAKDGCYLHSWSASYHRITRDIVITAVWEWETSIGFDYAASENSNYCEITGCFKDLVGDVYVGVYYDDKKVLGIRDNAFADCDGITYIHMLDGILSIGNGVFTDCDSLVSVELPGTLAKLGDNAFAGCDSLTSIVLPDELTTLGTGVFSGCKSLTKVVIPDSLTYIPARAFEGCTSLTEIVIPSSVKLIDESAFEGCVSLEKITFEVEEEILESEDSEDEKSEDKDKEKDKNNADETVDENVERTYHGLLTIRAHAFRGCTSLTEVILPLTVQNIEAGAFDATLLTVKTPIAEADVPEGWQDGWSGSATVVWEYAPIVEDDEELEKEPEKQGWLS
jgi:hypothetical protein